MTIEELLKEIKEKFTEINKDDQYKLFIVIEDGNNGSFKSFGYGCMGCIAEKIAANLDLFDHNSKETVN